MSQFMALGIGKHIINLDAIAYATEWDDEGYGITVFWCGASSQPDDIHAPLSHTDFVGTEAREVWGWLVTHDVRSNRKEKDDD